MNQFEFYNEGLHNRLIRFSVDGLVLRGVLADDAFNSAGKSTQTDYSFIPYSRMKQWKEFEKLGDRQKMNALTSVIDIKKIAWAEKM